VYNRQCICDFVYILKLWQRQTFGKLQKSHLIRGGTQCDKECDSYIRDLKSLSWSKNWARNQDRPLTVKVTWTQCSYPPGIAADTYPLKLPRLKNRVLHTTGNFPRHTLVCDLHVAFKFPYVYDFITILRRQHAEVIQNHQNPNVSNTKNTRGLKLVAVKPTTVQVTKLLLQLRISKDMA
jgi:hypothetical protein